MAVRTLFRSRTVAVLAGASVLVSLGGVGGAVARGLITSADIKNGQVKKVDIGDDAVGGREVVAHSLGMADLNDATRAEIKNHTRYAGPHWGIVDRNVIGNGDAYLRSGPYGWDGSAPPPLGEGSLGLRTGSGTDKVAFGNEVDYFGDPLSSLTTLRYSVFTTGENGAGNLPNLQLEIDPHTARTYSTLVFVPETADAGAWTTLDASTAQRWYLTGGAGDDTGCNQTTYCTLADVQAKLPDATIDTVQINKGRDSAFSGAVDDLVVNDTAYDFEPFGVTAMPAS